jgi:hypothetical protein
MRLALLPHPESAHRAVTAIAVNTERKGDVLSLTYRVEGDIAAIALPPQTDAARTDELWKHTCFEAFIRADGAEGYLEFNFSPSTQWAAYRFDGYRAGMRDEDIDPPCVTLEHDGRTLTLSVTLNLSGRPEAGIACDMNVTAIIEDTAGARAFWALAHAPGKPDFHSADCFIARVPPA